MQIPLKPADELTRLDTLRSLNILDTAPEERFDRLTRLAQRLFGVPIALVSLVDADRQWFKSHAGLAATETPRDVSFCGHAILGDDILMVPDALADERFHDNPLVTGDPKVRFYAGCPLRVPGGGVMGTLCLIDDKPRELGDEDRALLRDLASMAEQEIAAFQLATTDELTKLSNRRGFDALAQHALKVCKRIKRTASMLYFDLSDFKKINDTYGHAEGDRALAVFGDLLRTTLRDCDVIGRIGGDEFAALLTDSNLDGTAQALQRLQHRLDAHNLEGQRGYAIRFNVGQTEYDAHRHTTVAQILAEADAAMYVNKRALKALVDKAGG